MPLYDHRCCSCGYESTEFVWITAVENVVCPRCGKEMERLFTPTTGPILGRQKPVSFKFDPHEPNADKSIWKSVIADAEKGTLRRGEFEFWKKEIGKTSPNIIL